jgi:hypothetical protein
MNCRNLSIVISRMRFTENDCWGIQIVEQCGYEESGGELLEEAEGVQTLLGIFRKDLVASLPLPLRVEVRHALHEEEFSAEVHMDGEAKEDSRDRVRRHEELEVPGMSLNEDSVALTNEDESCVTSCGAGEGGLDLLMTQLIASLHKEYGSSTDTLWPSNS